VAGLADSVAVEAAVDLAGSAVDGRVVGAVVGRGESAKW
jgi:hypothetical protein